MPRSRIKSPCINVCAVDGQTGYCLGCARTLQEIAAWQRYTTGERDEILETLSKRKDTLVQLGKLNA